jgi:hypothetical protein
MADFSIPAVRATPQWMQGGKPGTPVIARGRGPQIESTVQTPAVRPRAVSSGARGSPPPAKRPRLERALNRIETPGLCLDAPQGSLEVAAARCATPLSSQEQKTVRGIFLGCIDDVKDVTPDGQGNQTVMFTSVDSARCPWYAVLCVDAQGAPICLKAWSDTHRLALRWHHPDDDHWVKLALQDIDDASVSEAVPRFRAALKRAGGMQELLREVGDPQQSSLGSATEDCLRAVLLSMSARDDEDGQRVCEYVMRAGATPATLHLLDRAGLVAALSLQGLRPEGSDLRWWPPTRVGLLVNRLAGAFADRVAGRAFMNAVYRGSEAVGNGNVWPTAFTTVLWRGDPDPCGAALHMPELWFMQAQYFESTDREDQRCDANWLLRSLQYAVSVADPPRTMQQVVELEDADLKALETSDHRLHTLLLPTGLLCWSKNEGQLQALLRDFKENNVPRRVKQTRVTLDMRFRGESYPVSSRLLEKVETARELLQRRVEMAQRHGHEEADFGRGTAGKWLRAYSCFLRRLEGQPLRQLLRDAHPEQLTFGPKAEAVLWRDAQDRENVMEHFFDLPVRVQRMAVEAAAAQKPVIRLETLRSCLNLVHVDRMYVLGDVTSMPYRSPLQPHQVFTEPGFQRGPLSKHASRTLNRTLRVSDEEWIPGRLPLVQQSLLVPDGSTFEPPSQRDAAGAGVDYLTDRVDFHVDDIRSALQRMMEHAEAGCIIGDARYRPAVPANVQWQQQVGEWLTACRVDGPDLQNALRTTGLWMRHHEGGMRFNPFNNHVVRAVRRHPSLPHFLQSVREDLRALAAGLERSWREKRQEWEHNLIAGTWELPTTLDGKTLPIDVDFLEEQIEHLRSLNDAVVDMAFEALHGLASEPRALRDAHVSVNTSTN